MTPPEKLRDLLKQSSIVTDLIPADNIYAFNLPTELTDKTTDNVCLIRDVSNNFTDYSSDRSHSRQAVCEIQVWFVDTADINKIQLTINNLLEENEWYCLSDSGINTDPDTLELYWTTEYTKNERIDNIAN